jgi:hypothetical protein
MPRYLASWSAVVLLLAMLSWIEGWGAAKKAWTSSKALGSLLRCRCRRDKRE